MNTRQVLFIAYNFPPHGGAGVQRTLKFMKYLPEFGWQPIVVTTTADASLVQDPSLLTDIQPDTPVYRIPGFSIFRLIARARKVRLGKMAVFLNLLLQIPDPTRFWAQNTHPTVTRIIQNERPAIIYTTSGPYSAHLVGRWAKTRFQIPWFADFRDPWSRNLLVPYLPGYRKINQYLEKQVLKDADRVACVSQPWMQDLQSNLGKQANKFLVLTNGYDDQDLPSASPIPSSGPFTITHLGSFYRNRRPIPFLRAIESLYQSGRIPKTDLRVQFIGKNTSGIAPSELPFETYTYIPHKDLDRFWTETHGLLLVLDTSLENVGNHSGKLFEYLASNRPILGIVPTGGVAQELIKTTRTGKTVNDQTSAIAEAIFTLYSQWKDGTLNWDPNWELIQQYTRRNLTKQLAAEFDRLAKS